MVLRSGSFPGFLLIVWPALKVKIALTFGGLAGLQTWLVQETAGWFRIRLTGQLTEHSGSSDPKTNRALNSG